MTNKPTIEQSLENIQARLSVIEKKLKLTKEPKKTPPLNQPQALSGNLLGVVSSICFILAAGLIIKLSIESGWLNPEKQLGLATLLGLALFAGGILISNTDKLYASFLPAAGSTILYLTCFASYQFYFLISFQTVIAITCIITSLSLWFYVQFKHDIYAVIAAIGAYSVPFVGTVDNNIIFILYYLIICSLTFATLSIWVQSRTLTVISSYLAIAITAIIGLHLDMNTIFAGALALHFFIFSVGTYFYTQLNHHAMSEKEAWSFFPILLIFYTMEYYFISRIHPALASLVSLASAGLLILLYLSAKRWSSDRTIYSSGVVLSFATLVFFHSIYLELLPPDIKPWLFVLIIMGTIFIKSKHRFSLTNTIMIVPMFAFSAILGIEYLNMLSHLALKFNFPWALVSWVSFLSLWYVVIKQEPTLSQNKNTMYFILAACHFLGIMGLYQLTLPYGSLAISASWLTYALVVLYFAHIKRNLYIAKSVLIILSFATGKALLYDAISTPNIRRTLSLILTGIVLYISGLVLRKMFFMQIQLKQSIKKTAHEKTHE